MEKNNYEQFFNEVLDMYINNPSVDNKENGLKCIKNTIINTYNFKNNSINKEVLLPQCVTIIDFLINNDKNLTKEECDRLFDILSESSSTINSKIYTLKRRLNSIKEKINSDETMKYGHDYRAFKAAASSKLAENEIKDIYLEYISNR